MRFPKKFSPAHSSIQQVILILGVCVLVGCASVDNALRVPPSSCVRTDHFDGLTNGSSGVTADMTNVNGPSAGLVLYAVQEDGRPILDSHGKATILDAGSLSDQLYVTADVSYVLKNALTSVDGTATEARKERTIRFLIYLSDHNSEVWMNRTFALNKFRKGTVGGIRDLATAGAGASALISPPAAVVLSALNLYGGTVSDQIDTVLYSGDSIETLFKGINASRSQEKAYILSRVTDTNYDMFSALSDVRFYDSLVSFRKGLAYLSLLADKNNQAALTNAAPGATTKIEPVPNL